jgi:pre-mRNA 3'-end-processing factor FIP1
MSHEEDDDAFLYGSDDESVALKKQKLDNGSESATKTAAQNDRDVDGAEEKGDDNDEGDEDDDSEEEDDSDSDIEFIVSTEEPKAAAGTEEKPAATVSATASTGIASTVSEAIGEVNDLDEAQDTEAQKQTTEATITRVPDVDINKVGEYDGKPITNINIQDLKEKPWRQPGADVSEYFNYGFDEFTWVAYCAKQDNLRANFNPQKVMMSMMPMGLPMMMPGMPPMPGMPTMPAMPGMPGLPQPPSVPGAPGSSLPLPPQSQDFSSGSTPQNDGEGSFNNSTSTPQPPMSNNSYGSNNSLPRAPTGPSARNDRDFKDREFERSSGTYDNDYRERAPRRGRNRGRR